MKSLRDGKGSIADSYAIDNNGEMFLVNSHIPLYRQSSYNNHDPKGDRKLLLKKKEINKLIGKGSQTGAETEDENTPGANTGVPAGSGQVATQRGIFRDFIDDFASLFKNDGQSFILKLGKTFLSGSLAFKDLLTGLISGVGSILSSAGSGIFGFASSLFFRYGGRTKDYSTGGIARGPQSGYPAMLHGNEAVVPLPNGRAIPVEMANGGKMNTNNTNITVNIAEGTTSTVDTDGGAELGKVINMAVQNELEKQMRPGGILAG